MKLQNHVDLTPLNTFGLRATARDYIELREPEWLPAVATFYGFSPETTLWLGGGSNVLFSGDYPGLVVRLLNEGVRETKRRTDSHAWVRAEAGENWHKFVQRTLKLDLSGLENLSLIPGTVGAAPVQNIGAYGVEVKDRIETVHCFDLQTLQFIDLDNAACRFGYRDSIFKHEGKNRYVIIAVTFKLDTEFQPNIGYGELAAAVREQCGSRAPTAKDISDAVCRIRAAKLPDPEKIGNVGSFYKNPVVSAQQAAQLLAQYPQMPHYPQPDGQVKLAAAWLIDQCGLKGCRIGDAAVHDKQALVLVNTGNATAEDVARLSNHITQQVRQKFQIALETEPTWLPEVPKV